MNSYIGLYLLLFMAVYIVCFAIFILYSPAPKLISHDWKEGPHFPLEVTWGQRACVMGQTGQIGQVAI